jgi:hypothetical protein
MYIPLTGGIKYRQNIPYIMTIPPITKNGKPKPPACKINTRNITLNLYLPLQRMVNQNLLLVK